MKRVHNTEQLMHLYSNTDAEGFKTPSRNVYVERGTMYSYGSHYPMAHRYGDILVVNSRKSSVTTEKHKTMLKSAWSRQGRFIIELPYVNVNAGDVFSSNEQHLFNMLADGIELNCFKTNSYCSWQDINFKIMKINLFYSLCNHKTKFELPKDFEHDLYQMIESKYLKIKDRENLKLEAKAKKDLKTVEIVKTNLKYWLAGSLHDEELTNSEIQTYCKHVGHDLVRIRNEARLETQRGAEVCLQTAKVMLKAGLDRGFESLIGYKINEFRIDAVNGDILTIGCHKISIQQIREVLGV